jgi:hypothetical protein
MSTTGLGGLGIEIQPIRLLLSTPVCVLFHSVRSSGSSLRFIVSLQSCSLICPRYDTEEAHQVLSFEPIFACKELQKLNVIAVKLDYISDPKAIIDQEQETIWDMEQWLMDEFAARGKLVDVQTDYVSRSSDKEESDEEESDDEEASDDEEGSNEEYVYTCPRSNQLLTDPW